MLVEEILNIMLHNCRMPEWNRSDFFAIIAALRLAERRVRENIDRFGVDTYISAMWDMLDRNKVAMGAIITHDHSRRRPQGVFRGLDRR